MSPRNVPQHAPGWRKEVRSWEGFKEDLMMQPRKVVWMAVLAGALLLLPGRAVADNSNGSLKVTSFPSGAHVFVDGADTGKVTPMNVSVSVGTHTVVVSVPDSGWNPD